MNSFEIIKQLFLNNDNCIENSKFIELSKIPNRDNIEKWLIDYEQLNIFCESNEYNPLKLYYFNKNYIHRILYDREELIMLNSNKNGENLSYYFYLSLLIRDNQTIINYSYPFKFIKDINDNIKNDNNKYKKLILSKIILELIENYKGLDEYDENRNKIENIVFENNKIIKDNIDSFNKEFNLEWKEKDIKSKKIDEIYLEIIKSLIENNKFDNYEYIYNIIKQLDLESIDITKFIYDGIHDIINKNQNKYLISSKEDLFNNEKINYYYIILKYILKTPFFNENKKIYYIIN